MHGLEAIATAHRDSWPGNIEGYLLSIPFTVNQSDAFQAFVTLHMARQCGCHQTDIDMMKRHFCDVAAGWLEDEIEVPSIAGVPA